MLFRSYYQEHGYVLNCLEYLLKVIAHFHCVAVAELWQEFCLGLRGNELRTQFVNNLLGTQFVNPSTLLS